MDIKTTSAQTPDEFRRKSIYQYRYDLQAAMYLDGSGVDEFYFICLPKNPPHIPYVVAVTYETFDKARKEFYDGIKFLKRCMDNNDWPGFKMSLL